jgi:hypothetical protein
MKIALSFFGFCLLLLGCGKDDPAKDVPKNPAIAKLIFPYQNSLCTVGTNTTATESTVLFEWEKAAYSDSYELVLKNLITGGLSSHQTTNSSIPLVLERGIPYKWFVISKSSAVAQTTQSDSWKFFNAGVTIQSYAPFPAEIVSPAMAATITITANIVTLDWNGIDVDNDIIGYDVYFGTTNTPAVFKIDLTESILNNVPVTSNMIYYWKIITKDSHGNISDSGVFQFKIL